LDDAGGMKRTVEYGAGRLITSRALKYGKSQPPRLEFALEPRCAGTRLHTRISHLKHGMRTAPLHVEKKQLAEHCGHWESHQRSILRLRLVRIATADFTGKRQGRRGGRPRTQRATRLLHRHLTPGSRPVQLQLLSEK
jgi:hypothetical protein